MLIKMTPVAICLCVLCYVFSIQAQPPPPSGVPATVETPVAEVADPEVIIPAAEQPDTPVPDIELPEEGEEVSHVINAIQWIVEKWTNKEYGAAIAAMLMLLLVIANLAMHRLGTEIRKAWMPTVSVATGIGVALSVKLGGLAVGASSFEWFSAVGQGLLFGMAAVGAWEWIGKKVFKKFLAKSKEKGDARKVAKELKKAGAPS